MSGDASCCGGVTAGKDGGLCARIGSFAVVVASGLFVVLMLRGMNGPLIGASDIVRDNLRTLIRASDDIATHRLLGRSATHTGEAPSTIALAPQFEFDFQDKGAYTSSEVAPCRPEVRYLQVYHLSKCGGTNFRQVLRATLNVTDVAEAAGEKIDHGWWFEDHGVMRRERENYPDPRYKRDPASPAKREAFIIGLIRNPFGYYRSFYSMLLSHYAQCPSDPSMYDTEGEPTTKESHCSCAAAARRGKLHLLDHTNARHLRNSTDAFREYLDLAFSVTEAELDKCPTWSFTRLHDSLYAMQDGSVAFDALVRQEDYYPSARRAFERFADCMSGGGGGGDGVVNFERFDALAVRDGQTKRRRVRWFERDEQLRVAKAGEEQYMPDHCFYAPDMVDSVMKHDATIMQRYGYTWEAFVGEGKDAECAP